MGIATTNSEFQSRPDDQQELRGAPRFTSLIRAAKLVCGKGEFVCVIRDVSATGVGLRCFHAIPRCPDMALEMQDGTLLEMEAIREEGFDASFRFARVVPVEQLIHESAVFPRRRIRLNITIPLSLRTLSGQVTALTENISQQGCRIEAAVPLAIAQPVIVESAHLPGIRAKVRWRQDGRYGLIFDDTFSLREFAIHSARLQCPSLLTG